MDRERELPVNPEVVWGREFRVPAIIGQGSGLGFEFSGLHLPRRWEKAIPELRKIDYGQFDAFFTGYCLDRGFNPGNLKHDSATGVLEELTIITTPISMLYLDRIFPYNREGIYRARNVNDLGAAIILQRMAVAFLQSFRPDVPFPYIDGGERGYYSCNLEIPKEFLELKEPVTNAYYQRDFEMRASNIAGRFGLTLKTISFDERGLLHAFDVCEGDACGYYLDRYTWSGEYHGHNVDTPQQVATLHGIAASFINELLRRKDGQYY